MTSLPFVSSEKISEFALNPQFTKYLQVVKTSDQARANRAVDPMVAQPETLVFVSTPDQLDAALRGQASILIASEKLKPREIEIGPHQSLFSTPAVTAVMAMILPLFDHKKSKFYPGVHPTAAIDSTARIGKNARIGAYTVIGPGCVIGDEVYFGSHVTIESGAQVGSGTILHSQVYVGFDCVIGKNCEIHPHVTIGGDGFGFVQGPDQKRNKIPQLGIVVIEDSVEIGANCAIDRATLGETRIGSGTKFDNLCHVAHNCKIGKNCVFAGGFMIAGSSEIGDNCMVGGGTLITDHVKVGDNVIIGGRAGVTKDVQGPGAFSGYPLEPFKDSMRTTANMVHVTSMRKQIAQIRKHLGMKDEES